MTTQEAKLTSWADRPQVQFGDMGEKIVLEYAKSRGWHDILQKGDNPSAVDFIFADENGKIVEIAEVKTRKSLTELYDGVYAYAISNDQYKRNYQPIKDEVYVDFTLYVVNAEQGKIYSGDFNSLEDDSDEMNFDSDSDGTPHCFPITKTERFGEQETELRYYAGLLTVGWICDFGGTPEHEKLKALAAKVTVDTIDDSPIHEPGKRFISAEDIIEFVNSYQLKPPSDDEIQFGGWSLPFPTTFYRRSVPYFFMSNEAFVSLNYLKTVGVSLWLIPDNWHRKFDGESGEWVSCDKLDSIFLRQLTAEPWVFWDNHERKNFNGICEARKFFKEYFNLNMPDDTAKLYVKIQNMDLQREPRWFLRSCIDYLYAFDSTLELKVFRRLIIKALQKECYNRYHLNQKDFDFIELKTPSKLVHTVRTPQGITLDIISTEGKFFVGGNQIGQAWGYGETGALSSQRFLDTVAEVAQWYKVRRPKKTKPVWHVLVGDVEKVLRHMAFTTLESNRSQIAAETLTFWKSLDLSRFTQTTAKTPRGEQN